MASKPAQKYAVVLADGTSEQFKTKRQAVARGEHSGQAFTVLSPRGYEVHVAEAPQAKTATILADELKVGMTVVGTRVRNPAREIAKVAVGRKFVTVWDAEGKDFGYWPLGTKVEVVE